MAKRARRAIGIAAFAVAYVVVARLALKLDAVGGFATLVWPPAGMALAATTALGYDALAGVAVGAFVVNAWIGAPPLVALAMGAGNALEALAGAWALRRFAGGARGIARLRDVIVLLAAAFAAPSIAATIGTASLARGSVLRAPWADTWRAWWLGDALGMLLVGALILAWIAPWPRAPRARTALRALEAIALAATVAVVTSLVFVQRIDANGAAAILGPYAVLPLLVWAALRFGLRGATLAAFAVSSIAVAGTASGGGPFVHATLAWSLLYLQACTAVVAATALVLGAAVSEREAAVRARDELLAIVSHDLRGPLGTIRLASGTVQRSLDGDRRVVREALAVLDRSSRRMEALVRDLLDVAAYEAGVLTIAAERTDAASLVRDAIGDTRAAAEAMAITIDEDPPRGALSVACDRARVLQVLGNLVDNAIRHTPRQGRIVVGAAEGVADEVRFSVRDDGEGIAAEDLPHVFDRFRRGAHAGGVGLGLGLYIARSLVEAHGGRIGVESAKGVGATFWFTLPRARDSRPSPAGGRVSRPIVGRG